MKEQIKEEIIDIAYEIAQDVRWENENEIVTADSLVQSSLIVKLIEKLRELDEGEI